MTCQLDADPARSIELLASVAAETTAFLDATAQAALWRQPAWLACPPSNEALLLALALLSAASAGDHAGVIGHGQRLLGGASPASLASQDASRYFAGAVLFASLAGARPDVADRFMRDTWDRLPQPTREDRTLQLLWAISATADRRQ